MAQLKYLDLTGLETFWGQAKTYIDNGDASVTSTITGTSSDTSSDLTLNGLKKAIEAAVGGSVASADKLSTARTISLSGDASGSVSFDGSQNVDIAVTVADDSHNHVINNVDGLQGALDAKAPLASPNFTGTPTAPTAAANTNTTQIATTAFVKAAIDSHIASAQALEFKGVATTATETPASPGVGDVYIASEAGTIFGKTCEQGDMLIYSGTGWYVVQANIDGAVTGPTSAISGNIATFDGTTGKIIQDSGIVASEVSAAITKLENIASGAEVNQNAFTTINAGGTNVTASAKTDTVTITGAGGLTVSASGKTITLTAPASLTAGTVTTTGSADSISISGNKINITLRAYALASEFNSLKALVGSTSVASQIDSKISSYDTNTLATKYQLVSDVSTISTEEIEGIFA